MWLRTVKAHVTAAGHEPVKNLNTKYFLRIGTEAPQTLLFAPTPISRGQTSFLTVLQMLEVQPITQTLMVVS